MGLTERFSSYENRKLQQLNLAIGRTNCQKIESILNPLAGNVRRPKSENFLKLRPLMIG